MNVVKCNTIPRSKGCQDISQYNSSLLPPKDNDDDDEADEKGRWVKKLHRPLCTADNLRFSSTWISSLSTAYWQWYENYMWSIIINSMRKRMTEKNMLSLIWVGMQTVRNDTIQHTTGCEVLDLTISCKRRQSSSQAKVKARSCTNLYLCRSYWGFY